jgi:hypothetical protein
MYDTCDKYKGPQRGHTCPSHHVHLCRIAIHVTKLIQARAPIMRACIYSCAQTFTAMCRADQRAFARGRRPRRTCNIRRLQVHEASHHCVCARSYAYVCVHVCNICVNVLMHVRMCALDACTCACVPWTHTAYACASSVNAAVLVFTFLRKEPTRDKWLAVHSGTNTSRPQVKGQDRGQRGVLEKSNSAAI